MLERKQDGTFQMNRDIHGESNVKSTAKRFKKANNLMLILCLNKTVGQLVMASTVCWNGDILRREDGHFLRRVFDFEVEGQRKIESKKCTWMK